VYIGSYYRRHVSDGESLEQLETSLHRASSIRNASIIIGGDFNLPGWDWRSTTQTQCSVSQLTPAVPGYHQ
jgi:endonuclease/exonuclease/phosphatase (EEP) superfamily protein YafD